MDHANKNMGNINIVIPIATWRESAKWEPNIPKKLVISPSLALRKLGSFFEYVTADRRIKIDKTKSVIPKVFRKTNCKNFFEYSFEADSGYSTFSKKDIISARFFLLISRYIC